MGITRKLLKGMGLSEEQQDTIIEEHTSTVNDLKTQRDEYKEQAEKVAGLEKNLEQAEKDLEDSKKDSYKVKYEALKEDFDAYKKEQQTKAEHEAKNEAYKKLLQDIGVSEKRIASVLKVSDVDGVELDDDGKIKTEADLKQSLTKEWADFIPTTTTEGANTPNPPANNGNGTMTKDDILKIKDATKRQKAISENLELFGKKGE